jgi:hypothetical protein
MPSPKLFFRCSPDVLARFRAACKARKLLPSEALRTAVEAWIGTVTQQAVTLQNEVDGSIEACHPAPPVTRVEPIGPPEVPRNCHPQMEKAPNMPASKTNKQEASVADCERLIAVFAEQGIEISPPSREELDESPKQN